MTKFEVQLDDGSSDIITADGWLVREDRVLSVYCYVLPGEGLPPGTKRSQLIAQYNAACWTKVIQCDSVEQAEAKCE